MLALEKILDQTAVARPDSCRNRNIVPGGVIAELEKHILVDGFKIVIDLERSRGLAPRGRCKWQGTLGPL